MAWELRNLKAPIPAADIEAIMAPLDSAVGSIDSVLTVVAEALDIVALFANPSTDPYNIIINAFYDELRDFVNNFFGTGAYFLTVSPFNVAGPMRHDMFSIPLLYPAHAIQAAVSSLDDLGDDNRPQFSNTAEISAIGIMATATNVQDFMLLLEALTAIFRIPAWEFALRECRRRVEPGRKSVQPDWSSVRLNSIDQMNQLQGAMTDALEVLRGYTTIPDNNIGDLTDALRSKVSSLRTVIQEVRSAVGGLLTSAGGLYVMETHGVGGNNRLKVALRDAKIENCKPNAGYTIMTVIAGGGPSLATVNAMRSLML